MERSASGQGAAAGSRRAWLLLALAASLPVLGGSAGCATGAAQRDAAFLRLDCNVPDATLWIDDRLVGQAAVWRQPRPMPAGFRRIELRHPGYFTFYKEVSPGPGETIMVKAEMRPELE